LPKLVAAGGGRAADTQATNHLALRKTFVADHDGNGGDAWLRFLVGQTKS
jgi:hypothetical protein